MKLGISCERCDKTFEIDDDTCPGVLTIDHLCEPDGHSAIPMHFTLHELDEFGICADEDEELKDE